MLVRLLEIFRGLAVCIYLPCTSSMFFPQCNCLRVLTYLVGNKDSTGWKCPGGTTTRSCMRYWNLARGSGGPLVLEIDIRYPYPARFLRQADDEVFYIVDMMKKLSRTGHDIGAVEHETGLNFPDLPLLLCPSRIYIYRDKLPIASETGCTPCANMDRRAPILRCCCNGCPDCECRKR